jgi:hypothetical protein
MVEIIFVEHFIVLTVKSGCKMSCNWYVVWYVIVTQCLLQLGENIIKGAKGGKVKILFQGLHMTFVIPMLVYNFKFCILDTQFNITC